ncbi:MAG TPA: hypothetical protein ENJ13_07975, partial [Chromatiales bacterium]|nr:hypothetical protein [Chromatiales bacterium]
MRLHRYIKETRSILGQPTLPHHLGKRLSAQGLCCLKNGIFLLIFLFITAIASPAHAAIVTWDGGGGNTNWNTCANWSLDTCPTAADIATFNATSVKNATITTDPNVDGIDIQAGYTGIISQNTGVTITVGAANFVQASGTFTGGDSAIQTTDLIINGGSFTATSGTMTVGDDFTISGGTFSHNGGTVTFTGGGNAAFTFDVAPTLNHVIFNRTNRIDITGTSPTLDIDGNFTLTSATDIDGGTILLAGNITTSDTLVTGNSAFTIDGGNTQTIDGSGANAALPNLTINKSGGSLTFLNDISINSNLTYTAGSVDTTTNNVTIQFGLTGINSTTFINSSTLQFNHVTFNKTNNLDVSGTMDINGNLTINSATNLRAQSSGDRITLAGNLISSDATIDGDLDIEFDGTT